MLSLIFQDVKESLPRQRSVPVVVLISCEDASKSVSSHSCFEKTVHDLSLSLSPHALAFFGFMRGVLLESMNVLVVVIFL